jgi:hypothetical protein
MSLDRPLGSVKKPSERRRSLSRSVLGSFKQMAESTAPRRVELETIDIVEAVGAVGAVGAREVSALTTA